MATTMDMTAPNSSASRVAPAPNRTMSSSESPEPTTNEAQVEEPKTRERPLISMGDPLTIAVNCGFCVLVGLFLAAFLWLVINSLDQQRPCAFSVSDRCHYAGYGREL
ncbi:uncharacterized protein GGS22DRAFT_192565 [Annulohypoxylon maeteangense]|uniref:uncharacterized protein n=1 Tax=Annulohypoxylon maeteangense TaxID=1927788 RepID=UPI0020075C63|nr:uncharacterized protein GGS22DRAFT_192565 [Annulohypoxylon maeteangense]KAI0881078.1 hypothetical protein GGS22DRAFT_192565 [Annulohypoxylon maeteangense]